MLAEARSLDPARVEDVVAGMVDAVHDGAAQAECDVDVVCEKLFTGFKVRPSAPELVAAEAALRRAATSRAGSRPAAGPTPTPSRPPASRA